MKKFGFILVMGLMLVMSACGPTAKEIKDKRIADSIVLADSLAMVQADVQRVADSIALAIADSCKADSVKKCCAKKKR